MKNKEFKVSVYMLFGYIVVGLLFFAMSCTNVQKAYYHTKKAKRHAEKASFYDPSIRINETEPLTEVRIVTNDSIVYVDDTVHHYHIDSIFIETKEACVQFDFSGYMSPVEARAMKNMYEDSLKHVRKMTSLENKRAKNDNKHETKQLRLETKGSVFWSWIGRRWWVLLITGYLLNWVLRKWVFSRLPKSIGNN